jgi:16S rRNA (cytosine1402-N4)-methyltransferase
LIVRRTNFAGLHAAIAAAGWIDGADFVFADLGVSSMQLDDPARGFTFKADGPLDLRMNPARGAPAAAWLRRASLETMTAAFRDNADEPHAEVIATALAARRGQLETTGALADAVRGALGVTRRREEADLSVRRVFQAIRIAVNDEFGALDALLRQLPACLAAGGRAAVLTFHSGEDRRVKKALEAGIRDGTYDAGSTEVIRPSLAEQRANPRAKSAKLRWARRPVRSDHGPAPTRGG